MEIIAGKSELQVFNIPAKQLVVQDGAFVDYLPLTVLDQTTTSLDFLIQASDVDYLDLNDSYLYVRFKVVQGDGKDLDATSECKPVNYLMCALFSDVKLYLNDTLIEGGGGDTYPYKAVIESIFNFNEDSKRIQLLSAGFSDDANERKKWIAQSRTCELVGALRLNFFSQPKYILPNVKMRLELTMNKDAFSLIVPKADAAGNASIRMLAARLYVRRVRVNDSVRIGHKDGLQLQNAIYPYVRAEVITSAIPQQSHYYTKDNLFGHSQMPKFVVLGLVKSAAYKGSYDSDPFMFNSFDVQSIGLYRDGESVPCRRIYEQKFDDNLFTDTYFRSILLNTQHYNSNQNNGIRMEDFRPDGGYTFYTFNLAPDFDMFQTQQISDGNLRLDIKFSKPNKEAINVIAYALYDDVVQITEEYKVIKQQ